MVSYYALDAALNRFSVLADRVRQDLYYCDVAASQLHTRMMRRNIHAASYVYLAAALEFYISDALRAVIDEINSRRLANSDLRLSLASVLFSSHFDALRDVAGLKHWNRRVSMLEEIAGTSVCTLSTDQLPLDGGTIRPKHLETIWAVFGFPGPSIPSPRDGLALTNLADSRNAVAHGTDDPHVIAGQRSVGDTLQLLLRIEGIVLHVHGSAETYLSSGAYRR